MISDDPAQPAAQAAAQATQPATQPDQPSAPGRQRLQLTRAELDTALQQLVSREVISTGQAGAVQVAVGAAATSGEPTRLWVELAGYLGGALMLGGALSLTQLTRSAMAMVLCAVALALLAAAVLVGGGPVRLARMRQDRRGARRRISAVLLALACLPTAGAVAGVVHTDIALIAGGVGLAVAAAGYAVLPSVPGLLACAVMSFIATTGASTHLGQGGPAAAGVTALGLGLLWLATTLIGLTAPAAAGYAISGVIALLGTQLLRAGDHQQTVAGALAGVALAVVYLGLYRLRQATTLVVLGVVAAALAVPEAAWDLTNGATGGAVSVLTGGAILVVASVIGLRRRRQARIGIHHG